MCIIVHKKAGAKLRPEIWEECWRVNNDGVGLAYVDPDKKTLVVDKGFMNKKDALAAIAAREELELLVHFRKTSRGGTTKENCHPFLVETFDDDKKTPLWSFAIAHNGTFDIKPEAGWSDTRTFVELVLKPWLERDPWLFDHNYSRFVLEGYCKGGGMGRTDSKFAVMRYNHDSGEMDTFIINRKLGNEKHDCWFSNYSWMPIADWRQQNGWDNDNRGKGYYVDGKFIPYTQPTNPTVGGAMRGQGGSVGTHINGRADDSRSDTILIEGKPFTGEGFADHNGWRFHSDKKMFWNQNTGVWVESLSYRKEYDDEYVYYGDTYYRTKHNWDASGKAYPITKETKITQTTLPGVAPVTQSIGDMAEMNKPGDGPAEDPPPDITDEEAFDALTRTVLNGSVNHLSKKERRQLHRIAADYCKASYGKDMARDMGPAMQLQLLRSDFLTEFPQCAKLNPLDFDLTIIGRGGFMPRTVRGDGNVTKAADKLVREMAAKEVDATIKAATFADQVTMHEHDGFCG